MLRSNEFRCYLAAVSDAMGLTRSVTTMPLLCHCATGTGFAAGVTECGTNIVSDASDSAIPATLLLILDFMMILPNAS
jgi:hypothetical protein